MVQRHHRLEQAGCAGRGLGMPDLRLHRSQGTPAAILAPALLENRAQRLELGHVAGFGAGAMSFHQFHGFRAMARVLVGPPQGLGLTRRGGRVNALGATVGRAAQSGHHGVDAITVTLGIRQALERHHANAFAQQGAVRAIRERPAVAGGRQCRRLAEADVHEDVVHGVGPASDDEIRMTHVQFGHGHRQS